MKTYRLEVYIDGDDVSVHEVADGLVVKDLRVVVSVFEEYKARIINELAARQTVMDVKKAE